MVNPPSIKASNKASNILAKAFKTIAALSLVICLAPFAPVASAYGEPRHSSLVDAFAQAQARSDAAIESALRQGASPYYALTIDKDHSGERAVSRARTSLPARYSLTSEGTVTYAKEQGIWNSCWAFGSIGAVESAILKQEKRASGSLGDASASDLGLGSLPTTPDLSEHALAWYAFTSENPASAGNQAGEGVYKEDRSSKAVMDAGGNSHIAAGKLLVQESLTSESNIPYTYREKTGDGYTFVNNPQAITDFDSADLDWALDEEISRRFVDTGYRVSGTIINPDPAICDYDDDGNRTYRGYDPAATETMKRTIMEVGALTTGLYAETASWWDTQTGEYTNYEQWCQYYNGDSWANHEILIVGWDDAYPASNFTGSVGGNPEGDGAWLVKNSWGSHQNTQISGIQEDAQWGIRDADGNGTGFFWVSYYDHSITSPTAYIVEDAQTSAQHTYQYDYLGTSGYSGVVANDEPFAAANVFTANGAEVLDAVTAFTDDADVIVDIDIYLLGEDDELPTDGRHVRSQKTAPGASGYHTIALDNPLQLTANQRFAVVESIHDSDGSRYHVNVELAAQVPGFYSSRAVINEGETFVSDNGEWINVADLNEMLSDEDLSLSAGNALIKAYTVDDPSPLSQQTLRDEESGITVSGMIASAASVQVVTGKLHDPADEGCALIDKVARAGHVAVTADVSMTGEYGRDMFVEVPVVGIGDGVVSVVHCNNGIPELLSATVKDGMASFRMKSFSPFAVLDGEYTAEQLDAMGRIESPQAPPKNHDNLGALPRTDSPTQDGGLAKTGDGGMRAASMLIVVSFFAAGIAALALSQYLRRRYSE